MPIRFGPWSTLLSLAVALGCAMALALVLRPVRHRANRVANRCLAALMLVVALKLVPYAIGYAGFYDAYPWLSFAPFDIGLALGPLLWLHVVALTSGRLPRRWGWHLLPAALQLAYYAACFAQPLAWKNDWNDRVHAPWLSPVENVLIAVSLALYLRAAWQRRRRHQAWLDDHASDADEHRFTALRNVIAAMALLLVLQAGYEIATQWWRLDYFQRFPLYLGLSALLYALGLEGWRQADRRHPVPLVDGASRLTAAQADAPDRHAAEVGASVQSAEPDRPPQAADATRQPDWQALGQRWRQRVLDAGWWREPELDLDRLARLLGTNTHYLSRAFNDGLQHNFAQVIAQMRVADVQAQLAAADPHADAADLLQLAFAAGFSSKSSFNRAFKAATGRTPSAYRATVQGAAAVQPRVPEAPRAVPAATPLVPKAEIQP